MTQEHISAERRQKAEAVMLIRMRGEPFTFADLYASGNRACGFTATDQGTFCYRLADRLIQRERKAGRISFTRIGRQTLWSHKDTP